jgi:putative PIN family toxin of toxin-antitoxin system
MLRVVLDTNIIVTGLRSSEGASAEVLRQLRYKNIQLVATPALFLEYEDVLKRPEQILATGLKNVEIDGFLSVLSGLVEPVELNFRWRPQLTDPDDEMFLEAAVNGKVDALVSFNERDFMPSCRMFGLTVMRPQELLRRLKNG